MIALAEIGDTLTFELGNANDDEGIHLVLDPDSPFSLPVSRDNLVWKAADAFYQKVKQTPAITITLKKSVPIGAGLGGGSSNAATTLLALNALYESPLSSSELLELGGALGSDVPFFFRAEPAFISGRGEQMIPIEKAPTGTFLIVNPRFEISTKEAYGAWDKAASSLTFNENNAKKNELFLETHNWPTRATTEMKSTTKNDFERVIFPLYPRLKSAQKRLLDGGALIALLCGSGASLFGYFETQSEALKSAEAFKNEGWWAKTTTALVRRA